MSSEIPFRCILDTFELYARVVKEGIPYMAYTHHKRNSVHSVRRLNKFIIYFWRSIDIHKTEMRLWSASRFATVD